MQWTMMNVVLLALLVGAIALLARATLKGGQMLGSFWDRRDGRGRRAGEDEAQG
jgi:hypothetical protein